jgi:hypothetical protein
MTKLRKQNPLPYGFILFASLLFLAAFILENINGRFQLYDFLVYYSAADALLQGEQVYGIPFGLGSGFYKYAPFVLFLFIPYCALSFQAASVIHFALLSFCFIASFLLLRNLFRTYFFPQPVKRESVLLSLSLVCVLVHVARELHLGNVNIVLVLLVAYGLRLLLQARDISAGVLIGLAILIKPYFLLLLLPLLFHGRIRALLSVAATGLVSLLIPTLVLGLSKSLDLHREWLAAMSGHSSYLSSSHTLLSLIRTYLAPGAPDALVYVIIAGVAVGYGVLFLIGQRSGQWKQHKGEETLLVMGYFGMPALIPNLVITDTEHFLYLLPFILWMVSYFFVVRNYGLLAVFILLILTYGTNSSDLLGRELSGRVSDWGLLGLSNLLLIVLAFYIFFSNRSRQVAPG